MHPPPRDPDLAPTAAVRAAVGVGANLGDRAATMQRALELLDAAPGVSVLACSSFFETPALTLPGAPAQPSYLNAACVVETTRSARGLLDALLGAERALGRVRAPGERWAARTIDLDLLLYDDAVIDAPGIVVPHPAMHERAFVLGPLAEVAPGVVHPVLGATVRDLLGRLSRR